MTGFLLVVMGVGGCIGVATSFLLGRDDSATSLARVGRTPFRPPGIPPVPGAVVGPPGADDDWLPDGIDVAEGAAPGAVAAPPRRRRLRRLEGEPYEDTPWWQRLRSALEIVVIAFVLGALLAAAIGVLVVGLFTLLRGAVG